MNPTLRCYLRHCSSTQARAGHLAEAAHEYVGGGVPGDLLECKTGSHRGLFYCSSDFRVFEDYFAWHPDVKGIFVKSAYKLYMQKRDGPARSGSGLNDEEKVIAVEPYMEAFLSTKNTAVLSM
jgi:hypothetical protein